MEIGDRVIQRQFAKFDPIIEWMENRVPIGTGGTITSLGPGNEGYVIVRYDNQYVTEVHPDWLDYFIEALSCAECNEPIIDMDYLCRGCRAILMA